MTDADTLPLPFHHPVMVARLSRDRETPVELVPTDEENAALARFLDVVALAGVRLTGRMVPWQEAGWRFEGQLAAEVEQACVITLEPVRAHVDQPVERRYLPRADGATPDAAEETEVDDDAPDRFADRIDLVETLAEALALAIEPYPRAEGAELGRMVVGPPGTAPLTDEAMRPFAGLEALKRKLESGGG
ncbi:DUF177 domain-containing protein [Paralimibaculum aggregatum]|uniref:DUF177 domain-containing protein n=1 Tax=Paralimibaculum aggregatum TaxID=3036245 RepID=A0ABQ6LEA2_9RHOB|nr:DUF177 domain-containing protein [Limibaculum sp. NKW23]GMG81679.1 DUF177 domain-containing protein [Limibaculum sp. NKW23]